MTARPLLALIVLLALFAPSVLATGGGAISNVAAAIESLEQTGPALIPLGAAGVLAGVAFDANGEHDIVELHIRTVVGPTLSSVRVVTPEDLARSTAPEDFDADGWKVWNPSPRDGRLLFEFRHEYAVAGDYTWEASVVDAGDHGVAPETLVMDVRVEPLATSPEPPQLSQDDPASTDAEEEAEESDAPEEDVAGIDVEEDPATSIDALIEEEDSPNARDDDGALREEVDVLPEQSTILDPLATSGGPLEAIGGGSEQWDTAGRVLVRIGEWTRSRLLPIAIVAAGAVLVTVGAIAAPKRWPFLLFFARKRAEEHEDDFGAALAIAIAEAEAAAVASVVLDGVAAPVTLAAWGSLGPVEDGAQDEDVEA